MFTRFSRLLIINSESSTTLEISISMNVRKVFRSFIRPLVPRAFLPLEGDKGIAKAGHRFYVGGHWEEIGKLQFDFLRSKGLKPESYLLDIACGSLRLGVKAIPFLEREHYLA